MRMDEDRKQRLVELVTDTVNADILNEEDALGIIDICQGACERAQQELMEEYLKTALGGEQE